MISGTRPSFSIELPRAAIALAGGMLLFCDASPPPRRPPRPRRRPAKPRRPRQPGMLDSIGRWFKNSFGSVSSSNVEGARDAVSGLGERAGTATRDAASAATRRHQAGGDRCQGCRRGCRQGSGRRGRALAGRPRGRRPRTLRSRPQRRPRLPPRRRKPSASAKGFGAGSSLEYPVGEEMPDAAWLSRRPQDTAECEGEFLRHPRAPVSDRALHPGGLLPPPRLRLG